MTPQSKAEAVRLANEESVARGRKGNFMAHDLEHNTALQALARYIEANPAISDEDRKRAGKLSYKQRVKGYWDTADCLVICDLLDLIAGPEEVDPLEQAVSHVLASPGALTDRQVTSELRTALHSAGYDIVKRGDTA